MARLSPLSLTDAERIPSGDADLSKYYAEHASCTARIQDERQTAYLASFDSHGPATVDRSPVGEWVNGVWRRTANTHHQRLAAFHGWLATRGD